MILKWRIAIVGVAMDTQLIICARGRGNRNCCVIVKMADVDYSGVISLIDKLPPSDGYLKFFQYFVKVYEHYQEFLYRYGGDLGHSETQVNLCPDTVFQDFIVYIKGSYYQSKDLSFKLDDCKAKLLEYFQCLVAFSVMNHHYDADDQAVTEKTIPHELTELYKFYVQPFDTSKSFMTVMGFARETTIKLEQTDTYMYELLFQDYNSVIFYKVTKGMHITVYGTYFLCI